MSTPEVKPACLGPLPRREFLRVGSLALGGVSLADLLAARARSETTGEATSVILFYMWGGPSHLETYDLKVRAPSEYRSVFRPIASSVAGMELCELFPKQAQVADRFSLVRSLHHEINIHNDAAIEVLTGKRPSKLDPTSSATSEHPDFGMIAARVRGAHPRAMPQYVDDSEPTAHDASDVFGRRALVVLDGKSGGGKLCAAAFETGRRGGRRSF